MQKTYKPEGFLIDTKRNAELISSLAGLEYAMQHDIILEGMAMLCDSRYDLHVNLGEIEGIIRRGEVAASRDGTGTKDIAVITRVGKPVCFKIKGFENYGGKIRAILSRCAAQNECYDNYLLNLVPGDIIPAKVTHLENFGAFVDIGCGIPSLLSVDCISVSRISHLGPPLLRDEYYDCSQKHRLRHRQDICNPPGTAGHMGGKFCTVCSGTNSCRDNPQRGAVRHIRRAHA